MQYIKYLSQPICYCLLPIASLYPCSHTPPKPTCDHTLKNGNPKCNNLPFPPRPVFTPSISTFTNKNHHIKICPRSFFHHIVYFSPLRNIFTFTKYGGDFFTFTKYFHLYEICSPLRDMMVKTSAHGGENHRGFCGGKLHLYF